MGANQLGREETLRIARDLAAKYGHDAIAFIEARAARAGEIGDELAYDSWQSVLAAAQELLARSPAPFR